jgi:aminopeptidase N
MLADMRETARPLARYGPISLGYRLGHLQSDGRVFRALVYNKSAVVLHMLRQLMGDDAFFAGLKQFYADWKFKKAGTDDLRLAMEAHTPMKLGRFFERWIGGAQPARLRFASRLSPDGRTATVRLEQVGELFDVPVTVSIQYGDGTTDEVLLKVHDAVHESQIPLKGPARRLSVRDDLTIVEIVR